jgi:polyisoprenyl-phosphate glycosyltransferase
MQVNKTVTIVVPFYNEQECLPELYRRLDKMSKTVSENINFLFVDDGSTDKSADFITSKTQQDTRVSLLRLSRNFGHQIAITAGIDNADSDAVVIIDADLQDPPEVIPKLLKKWHEGFKVVYAVRTSRPGETPLRNWVISAYYRLFYHLSDVHVPVDTGDFRLMDKKIVNSLKDVRELHRYIRGLTSWIGFEQTAVYYKREARYAGKTKYPVFKLMYLAFDAITSFTGKPLRWVTGIGFFVSLFGILWFCRIILAKIFHPYTQVSGWASIMGAVLLLGGIQLICLGLVGQYVSRTFEEVKKRPLYFIKEHIQNQ